MILRQTSTSSILERLTPEAQHLLLLGEECTLDIPQLIQECNQQGITIAGGIFPGVIHGEEHFTDGVIIKQLPANSSIQLCQDLATMDKNDLQLANAGTHSSIVLIDGLSKHITGFLENLFVSYWDSLKFIGGGCGSLSLKQQPCVFTNEGFFEDAAVVILQERRVNLGVRHGWQKIAGPFVVNASGGNTVHEIDWRSAFEVYREVIRAHNNVTIDQDDFFNVAKGYPFGIFREGMEDIVRDPIITDGKSLTCVGDVPNNVVINILEGKPIKLIRGAGMAAHEALSAGADDVLVIDCISRSLFLENQFPEELNSIQQVINTHNLPIPLEGVLSLGEISSYGDGYLEFFNKTIVVGAFHNHE